MARNKKVEILSNDKEVLHPMTDGDCVIFEDGQTLAQKLSEDDSVKYTPEIVNSSPMFKVGEGNTVDYSENVLDGAYERATLQGQTYVNYIQESSADEVTLPTPFTEYERTQHNTLTSDEEGTLGINLVGQSYVNALQHDSEEEFVVLGESLEFQEKKVEYTNEGQIKSAMLKGQTLVNLANQSDLKVEGGKLTKDKGVYTVTVDSNFNSTYVLTYSNNVHQFKPNTKYLVKTNVIENNFTTSFNPCVGHNSNIFDLDETEKAPMNYQPGETGTKIGIFTTKSDFTGVTNAFRFAAGTITNPCVANQTIKFQFIFVEYQEGMENWDIPYFEGMQSVTVSTRLENICQYADVENPKTGKTFNTSSSANRILTFMRKGTTTLHFKPNTKYLVQFKISNLVLDGIPNITLILNGSTLSSGDCLFGEQSQLQISSNNIYRAIFKTTDVVDTSEFVIKGGVGEWEGSDSTLRSMTISEIMCVEYQNGMENWDLPYFEDYQVMKPVQVESVNKNLFDKNNFILNKSLAWADGSFVTVNNQGQQASESYVSINYNSTYIMTGLQNGLVVCVYDHNKNVIGFLSNDGRTIANLNSVAGTAITSFNLSNYPHSKYVRFGVRGDGSQNVQDISNVQIEESSTATSYVPHQSKTTYSWDEVILRKIGDVEDTLDLTTGEWVQRIGEIVLDGSVSLTMCESTGYTNVFQLPHDKIIPSALQQGYGGLVICDKLPSNVDDKNETVQARVGNSWGIVLQLPTSLGINTVDLLNNYLKSNPYTVQYILAKPIVHKVNLSRPNLQVYDDITHVHTKCLDGTLIPNIYLPSDVSYPAILEPGKNYNVCVNHTEVSADNPLKVNVGGTEIAMTDSRMTLTTPTTLANSNVSFTGKGNKIKESMLIKNSSLLTRDLPHFNGIGSVQLGKTIENLCESRISSIGDSTMPTWNLFDDHIEFTTTSTGSRVIVSKLLKPLKNGKKYFVYAPNNYPANVAFAFSFSEYFNNGASFSRDAVVMRGSSKYAIIEPNQKNILYHEVVVGNHGSLPVGTYKIDYPIICEYEPGMENWDWESIGYFTGTKNIGNEFMRVQNKNLFDINEFVKYCGGTLSGNEYDSTGSIAESVYNIYIPKGSIIQYTVTKLGVVNGVASSASCFCFIRQNGECVHRACNALASYSIIADSDYIGIKIINYAHYWAFSNFQIELNSTGTTYTAHKHNSLHILPNEQIPLAFVQGAIMFSNTTSFAEHINNTMTTRIRTGLLDLEPNETYRISFGDKNYICGIAFYDNSNIGFNAVSEISNDYVFTTTKDVHKMCINIARSDMDANITPSVLHQVRLEKVTDVTLRGIGDVHDELDITRGIYTQRIGEIVLDGDEDWAIHSEFENTIRFKRLTSLSNHIDTFDGGLICNNFESKDLGRDNRGVQIYSNMVLISFNRTELQTLDNNGVKQWLAKAPTIINYQLATPIVHKVHIGNKNEANTEVAKPNGVFTLPTLYTEQTNIDLTNNGIIPKVQSRDYIAYPVLPMISRTYTLQHNLTGGVSNLTVDLLGRTQSVSYQNHKSLVYSPETMDAVLHNELRISGKGKISKVMYIDGGYMDRVIPYIEGMKNAVNPIVKNVGKNLFDGVVKNGESWWDGKIGILARCRRSVNLTPVKPNTEYIFKLTNRYGIGCGANFMAHGKDGKFLKYIGWVLSDTSKFTTPSDCYYIHWYNDIDDFTDFYIEEASTLSQYEPYKENILKTSWSIGYNAMLKDKSITSANGTSINNALNRYRTDFIKIEFAKIYINSNNPYCLFLYDINKKYLGRFTDSWVTDREFEFNESNAYYFIVVFNTDNGEDITTYISSKETRITLRSLPNGVCDELNLQTGEYIQRIGEIDVLNTIANWVHTDDVGIQDTNTLFRIAPNPSTTGVTRDNVLSNKFPTKFVMPSSNNDEEVVFGEANGGNSIYISIRKSRLQEESIEGFKQWLIENPTIIQYELKTPIVKQVDINNFPHSYKDGHVIIESNDPSTNVTAQLVYRAVTNRSGQIQQHTEQVEKQEREINELETLILANIHLSQTR